MRQNQILKLQIIQIKNNNLIIIIMKKINFAALQIATNIKKDEFITKDIREELANAMYQNARGPLYTKGSFSSAKAINFASLDKADEASTASEEQITSEDVGNS